MELIIISGYSGAGKSIAVHALEDIDYYCIDNLPPALISDFVSLCRNSGEINKVAIVTDIRGGSFFVGMMNSINQLRSENVPFKVLFLEADEDVLIKRYKETRRKHPLLDDANFSVEEAVEMEKKLLDPLRQTADYVINTSLLSAIQLRERTRSLFLDDPSESMIVHCTSFGFKYGPSGDSDINFDVRCLPNPYYIAELKNKTGLDSPVRDYVMSFDESKQLLAKLTDLIDFLIPLYRKEGKSQLVIAFGCTGGKHRSVTFAEEMHDHLKALGLNVSISHRDINKH